jgi:hypothetical protein
MARIIVRTRKLPLLAPRKHPMRRAGVIVGGLAVGGILGILLAELLAPLAQRATRRIGKPGRPSVAELVHDAQAVLDADLPLRECALEVIPVGRGSIELHGWVADRRARTRAATLVAQGVNAASVINCILVRGEDDVVTPPNGDGDDDDDALEA